MKRSACRIALGFGLLAFATIAAAQPLAGRHRIGLRLGMWDQGSETRVEIAPGTASTSIESTLPLGGLEYGHWLEENLTLTISVEAMSLDFETRTGLTGVTVNSAVVGSLLLGLKYGLVPQDGESSVRPHLFGALGLYRGSQDDVATGLTVLVSSREESAFGGRLGGGVDFILGRHLMVDLGIGYNFMTDFETPIGGRRNYGGPSMNLGFGYLFGSGVATE